jgi:hypothetical protein
MTDVKRAKENVCLERDVAKKNEWISAITSKKSVLSLSTYLSGMNRKEIDIQASQMSVKFY